MIFLLNISNFIYTFDKRNKKIKPYFKDKSEIKIEKIKATRKNYIVFEAAIHVDYVYMYNIILKNNNNNDNNKILKYYSDYYKNKKLRKDIMRYELPNEIINGKYNVEIFAIDSFNNTSEPLIGDIDIYHILN